MLGKLANVCSTFICFSCPLYISVQVSADKKPIGSTSGMQTSVRTSELLKHRASNIVPRYMNQMRQAVLDKDFPTFAEVTMKASVGLKANLSYVCESVSQATRLKWTGSRSIHIPDQEKKTAIFIITILENTCSNNHSPV